MYRAVERAGSITADELANAVALSGTELEAAVDRLTGKGYLAERDGALEVNLDAGVREEVETRDFTYAVRPARDDDFESLVELIRRIAARRTYAVAQSLAEELQYDDTVTRHNTVRSRLFFVATHDGEVIGWTHLDLPQVETLRRTAQVTVGVDEDYRGYGVGARLLERSLGWADRNGYLKVYNCVARTNGNAIAFLEANGWEREAVHGDHYTIGDRQVDEVMMAYTF